MADRLIMYRILCILSIFIWASISFAQIHLFRPEVKQHGQDYIYDFMERYLGEIILMSDSQERTQKLSDDKVRFIIGDISTINRLSDTTEFCLNCIDNCLYEATWTKSGSPILAISFPVSFELLLGMPKNEIELTLSDELLQINKTIPTGKCVQVKDLAQRSDSIYYTNPILHYQIESLNDCRFYSYSHGDNSFHAVFDTAHLSESAINLFHLYLDKDYLIDVEQGLYGFKSKKYTIRLSQWLNYCRKRGLTTYAALEEESVSDIKMLVVVESKELGFNHLLSVTIPKDFVMNPEARFNAKLNAYIPMHNVRNLYQQYSKKQKRDIKL